MIISVLPLRAKYWNDYWLLFCWLRITGLWFWGSERATKSHQQTPRNNRLQNARPMTGTGYLDPEFESLRGDSIEGTLAKAELKPTFPVMIWLDPSRADRMTKSLVIIFTSKRPPVRRYFRISPIFGLVIFLSFLPRFPDFKPGEVRGDGFGFSRWPSRESHRSKHIATPRRAGWLRNISHWPSIPGTDGISWQPPARNVRERPKKWKNAFSESSRESSFFHMKYRKLLPFIL